MDAFESKIFPVKSEGTGFSNNVWDYFSFKIFTPKQMLERLPITLAEVGNTYENLLNAIRQTIYSFCQTKEITKKVFNNIVNSVKV